MDPVSRLVAIEAIRQLKARYFRLLDTRDFDAMADVFCIDAVFDCSEGLGVRLLDGAFVGEVGAVKRGRREIMAWIEAAFASRICVHHGHGHEIVVESETSATGVIAMEDQIFEADRRTRLLQATGHYHERYRKDGDDVWRIASTRLTRLSRC